jgi:hypothetical protein
MDKFVFVGEDEEIVKQLQSIHKAIEEMIGKHRSEYFNDVVRISSTTPTYTLYYQIVDENNIREVVDLWIEDLSIDILDYFLPRNQIVDLLVKRMDSIHDTNPHEFIVNMTWQIDTGKDDLFYVLFHKSTYSQLGDGNNAELYETEDYEYDDLIERVFDIAKDYMVVIKDFHQDHYTKKDLRIIDLHFSIKKKEE